MRILWNMSGILKNMNGILGIYPLIISGNIEYV
jgi:hypothetical protein